MERAQTIHHLPREDARAKSPGPAMRIGEAARRVGVSPSVLRLWERQGLVQPLRTPAGYRLYTETDLEVLGRVRRMRSIEKVNAPGIRRILGRQVGQTAEGLQRGRRLRELRQRAGLSLRDAGQRASLSAGFVSAIERSASGASVTALQRLTAAYGGTLQDLFADSAQGRLVRPHERAVLQVAEGAVRMEQLAHAGGQLEPHLFVLAEGASSQGAYAHPGEEFIYVLEGSLRVWLGREEIYDLEVGDALTFASTLPHSWLNVARSETRLLWINTPPTF